MLVAVVAVDAPPIKLQVKLLVLGLYVSVLESTRRTLLPLVDETNVG